MEQSKEVDGGECGGKAETCPFCGQLVVAMIIKYCGTMLICAECGDVSDRLEK